MRSGDTLYEFEIVRAYVLLQAYADAVVPRFGLATHELHFLFRLRGEAPLTQAELGRRLVRTPMSVSRLVRDLESRGLLQRTTSPTDARARLVSLSARGDAMLEEV